MKAITLTLGDIGLIIVISMLVAVFVQVWLLPWFHAQSGAKTLVKPAAAQPAFTGIPQEHLAVITAAVAAMFSVHRIVRIETPERGFGWTAEARTVHHTSHAPR